MKIFDNPGRRIQVWAQGMFIVECIGLIVVFLEKCFNENAFWEGLLILLGGAAAAYVLSLFVVGFGQLIESTKENARTNQEILRHFKPEHKNQPPKKIVFEAEEKPAEKKCVLNIGALPKNPAFAKHLREALTFQSNEKMCQYLAKILDDGKCGQYGTVVQDILEEIPMHQQRKAVEELLQKVQ